MRAALVPVRWFKQTPQVTRRHGAASALRRIAADLKKLPDPDTRFVQRMGRPFNWRNIAGTYPLSVRSFAAAVDINPGLKNYWRWRGGSPGDVPHYENRVPENIIRAFKR
ncbi:MAG: hypothetical protein AAGJ70_05345 [Pseudomonadota bacterium]